MPAEIHEPYRGFSIRKMIVKTGSSEWIYYYAQSKSVGKECRTKEDLYRWIDKYWEDDEEEPTKETKPTN